jgi:metal-sulfur cluster biosynthetic enzyme
MIEIAAVHDALRQVADPCAVATGVPVDIVSMGLIADVAVAGNDVTIVLRLTSPFCLQVGLLSEQIDHVVRRLSGIGDVRVVVDHRAEWMPDMMDPGARRALRQVRPLTTVDR